ncbi:MAG: hypothetical protein KJO07_05910 [Deltaproteobacteria bacterium]|nr:hypothetical protein [Deltaproteobacteria bacterium]
MAIAVVGCVPAGPGSNDSNGGGSGSGGGGSSSGGGGSTNTASILGTYQGEQAWDLSEITVVDGGGDAVADLVVAEVVDATGLPSFLQDDATDVVDALIGDAVASVVDQHLGNSGIVLDLSGVLGTARLGTRLSLESRDGSTVTGQEELTSVILSHDGADHEIEIGSMLSVVGYDRALADVEGQLSSDDTMLAIAEHEYLLRVDTIIEVAGVEVLGYESLEAGLDTIIDCDDLLTSILGADGTLGVSVGGYDIELDASDLSGVCGAAKAELTGFVLDFFRTDAGVAAGGVLRVSGDTLQSTDYSGAITLLPTGIDPSFAIDYQVSRVP